MAEVKSRKLKTIEHAKNNVDRAERDLERLLGELAILPRAEKTTVSRVVEDAFAALRTAKVELAELEKLVSAESD